MSSRYYQFAGLRENRTAQKTLRKGPIHYLEARGRAGFTLAARSCSLLKVDPQVLQRHPVIGVRAAFATLIRDGLKDKPSSPPRCRHRCLGKLTSFLSSPETGPQESSPSANSTQG